jgi:DNA-binding beta-propeller fold protein YncE
MLKVKSQINPYLFLPVLLMILAVLCPFQTEAWGAGLSWGPVVEESSTESCTPEASPLFTQGPIRSPMRIVEYSENSFLLSDRSGSIYEVSKTDPDNPSLLFQVDGNPLGVAVSGTKILVGNEKTGKIDIYDLRREQIKKRRTIPKRGKIQPLDIAVDSNERMTFVVDGIDRDIKVYDRRGRLALSIGSFGQLTQPQALTLLPDAEEVIVTDYGDQSIGVSASVQIFDYSGRHLKTISGSFSRPQGVWATGASIYLVDAMLGQLLEFDRETGGLLSTYGCYGASDGHLILPMDVIYDPLLKQFFVADNRNGRVTVLPSIEQ